MYIYKMVYAEVEDFTEDEQDLLGKSYVVVQPDYLYNSGCYELHACNLQENKTDEIISILNKRLGHETVNALLKDEIDFVFIS